MKHKSQVAALAILLSFAVPHSAHAQNGIAEFEIPFNITTDIIECLGEAVELDFTVTVRTQFIEPKNGQAHYIENWFLEGTALGVNSGLTWYGHGPSPFVLNANGAQISNVLVANVTFEPLDGGQKFAERLRLQFVTDTNGTIRVDQQQHQRWRCLGT